MKTIQQKLVEEKNENVKAWKRVRRFSNFNRMKNVNWAVVRALEARALDIDPKIHFNPWKYCEDIEERMKQVCSTANCKYLLNFHIVWCPRGRVKILHYEARMKLREWIAQICEEKKWTLLALEAMPDHVHMFLSTKDFRPEVLGTIKGRTSSLLAKTFPEFKQAVGEHIWSGSYYISSVGNVSGVKVLQYITKQWKEYFPQTYTLLQAALTEGQKKLSEYEEPLLN